MLSTNEKNKLKIVHHNIANQTIQARRDEMDVTVGLGGKVHDYVPFYFSSINPMLLSLLNHKNCDQNQIIYLCINIERLDKDDAVFTNASANTTSPPTFYDDTSHLDELDWDLILCRKWKMDTDEAKHKKMAEALIHTKVDICDKSMRFLRGNYSNYSLELLSTVDYLLESRPEMKGWKDAGEDEVAAFLEHEMKVWSIRKSKMFKASFITVALRELKNL